MSSQENKKRFKWTIEEALSVCKFLWSGETKRLICMKIRKEWRENKRWMCVARRAELGCWRVVRGWPDEATCSTWVPLTLYICRLLPLHILCPLPLCVVPSPFAAFNENSVLLPSSTFHFLFQVLDSLSRRHHFAKLLLWVRRRLPIWRTSGRSILLFWYCFRIAVLSLLVHFILCSFGTVIEKGRESKSCSQKKARCLENNSPVFPKVSLWCEWV